MDVGYLSFYSDLKSLIMGFYSLFKNVLRVICIILFGMDLTDHDLKWMKHMDDSWCYTCEVQPRHTLNWWDS